MTRRRHQDLTRKNRTLARTEIPDDAVSYRTEAAFLIPFLSSEFWVLSSGHLC